MSVQEQLFQQLTRFSELKEDTAKLFAAWYMENAKGAENHDFTAVALEVGDEVERALEDGNDGIYEIRGSESVTGTPVTFNLEVDHAE